jgi:arylsulfatase A-like enzyme
MAQEQLIEPHPTETHEESEAKRSVALRSRVGLVLVSIVALVCGSLEIEVLEQLDSLSRYMTFREIALDAGMALLVLLGLAVGWWLCVLVLAGMASATPWTRRFSKSLVWHFGLAIPLSYFLLDLFGAVRLRVAPHWYPELVGWVWLSGALLVICIGGLSAVRVSALDEFCRTRLAPVGWFHIAVAGAAIIALWVHGVHLFHDHAPPRMTVAAEGSPDIYLITVDALRAEDMSVYGYNRPTTPNLERFARRSFVFDSAFANSNFTTSSTTSIETGKLPWSHRSFQQGAFLRGQSQRENLAEVLRQHGYYTGTISSNYLASPILHRTLESYDAVEYPVPLDGSGIWLRYSNLVGLNTLHTFTGALLTRLAGVRFYLDALVWSRQYPSPAEAVFDRARSLLQRPDISQPRFLWTHIFPPHDPYLAPPPYQKRFLPGDKLTRSYNFIGLRNRTAPGGTSAAELRARYDETVLYADHAVGDFLDWLDRTGRFDRSIVIVSADHGESFEHGWFLHSGPYLYDGVIHIPLLIHLPGQKEGGRIGYPAQQVDLLPTLLDLLGEKIPSWTDGTSLKPILEGKALPERYIFSMNLEPNSSFDPISKGTLATVDNEFKYIISLEQRQGALYRYKTDEFEDHNLIESEPEVAERMRTVSLARLKDANDRFTPKP